MSITVKSTGKTLAGTYKFDDRGLSNTPVSDASYTISMNFQPNGLKLDKKINKDLNAMTMVVAPGKYQKLEITYTVKNLDNNLIKTKVKTDKNITLKEGKNHKVQDDIDMSLNGDAGNIEQGGSINHAKQELWDKDK